MTVCRRVPETLVDYAFGDLEGEEIAQIEAHLAECAFCRMEVLQYRLLLRWTSQLPPIPPPPLFLERLRTTLMTAGSQRTAE